VRNLYRLRDHGHLKYRCAEIGWMDERDYDVLKFERRDSG
jgi:hypothetical protein